jgi:arsenite/tail-anchored protein-transporting ATPase
VSAADALVADLPATSLVVGKGGVGKTTCAAALALHLSHAGETLLISTDPARALPAVLDHHVDSTPTPIAYAPGLSAQLLDANVLRARFMDRWGEQIRIILDRGTYLDDSDIGPLVETALPGSDEIFAALEIARLLAEGGDHRLVIDTAPTGHTLRLLNLPRTFRALVGLLEAMQAKHRFMVRTLTRRYRSDEADAFLSEISGHVAALETALRDPTRCAAVMVTNPQSLVTAETQRFATALGEMRLRIAAVVWNNTEASAALDSSGGDRHYVVPHLDESPIGRQGLERWLMALRTTDDIRIQPSARVRGRTRSAPARSVVGDVSALLRPLTIVVGKGGVGKTTVAAALALRSADETRTLVVSTDPAPSLADALAQGIADSDVAVEGEKALFARQMDASAAFERLRDEYAARVDALFEGVLARGLDLAQDRAIARDLLSLAPPGIDEVYALSLIADALFERNYARVIVDPAPTGHLLRLLEMPQLALAWSHQLLRLMLKYKEVVGLGDAAHDVLAFAKNLRALDALLRDPAQSAIVLVTLEEPVVRAESERLAVEVARRGVSVTGVILNRARSESLRALPVPKAAMHFQAPSVEPPPIGRSALRRWLDTWHTATQVA